MVLPIIGIFKDKRMTFKYFGLLGLIMPSLDGIVNVAK